MAQPANTRILRSREPAAHDAASRSSSTKRARDPVSSESSSSRKKAKSKSRTRRHDVDDASCASGDDHSTSVKLTNGSKSAVKSSSTSSNEKRYWLMKAEQEDREVQTKNGSTINTRFTIDDLKDKGGPEPWDGVRNFVARNNMRGMKVGDLAFFYASGGKGSNKPGITGIMEIVKEHEVDFTMYDEGAYGYAEPKDRGPDDNPKWSLVHVQFKEKLATPVGLAELRSHAQPGQALVDMQLLRNGRISVSKVSPEEWSFITKTLVKDVS